jgi:hypothetical protein
MLQVTGKRTGMYSMKPGTWNLEPGTCNLKPVFPGNWQPVPVIKNGPPFTERSASLLNRKYRLV